MNSLINCYFKNNSHTSKLQAFTADRINMTLKCAVRMSNEYQELLISDSPKINLVRNEMRKSGKITKSVFHQVLFLGHLSALRRSLSATFLVTIIRKLLSVMNLPLMHHRFVFQLNPNLEGCALRNIEGSPAL